MKKGTIQLVSSDVLFLEVNRILTPSKRARVIAYIKMCDKHVEQNEAVEKIAQEIQNQCRIKARDSLHVASAIIGEVDYCLTCDDRVARWKNNRCIKRITHKLGKLYVSVMNPIRFIQKHFPGGLPNGHKSSNNTNNCDTRID